MGEWKRTASPKLDVPLELREVPADQEKGRVWEVQELRTGAVFKVHLDVSALEKPRGSARRADADAIERAVCLAVEEALVSPPDKEPGVTYEVSVTSAD